MTYTPDANELARRAESREEQKYTPPAQLRGKPAEVWGNLDIIDVEHASVIDTVCRCTLDLTKPGLLLAYAEDRSVAIYVLKPGWIVTFTPADAGE